jgi:hypothetical protein
LWVGTSAGLSRYDGINFKNFLKADGHFTGKIYAVKEDSIRNVLWIACDAGLCYFANEQLHFVRFKEPYVSVYDIYFKDRGMWIATGKGPAFLPEEINSGFNLDSAISLSSFLLPQWPGLDINSSAYKITVSERGDIYIAGEGVIFLYDKKSIKKIWTSQHQQNNNDNIAGMVPGKGDSIFFASVFGGLYYIKNDVVKKLPDDNYIAADLVEHNGQIYYFTSGGVYSFLTSTMSLKKLSDIPEKLNLWPSCLLVDNENNLWVGLHDNLIYQKPKIFFTYRSDFGGAVPELYSVAQMKKGQLLFGANRGKVYKKEGTTFENIFGANQLVPHAEIKSIYEDSRDWLWFGSGYEGIAVVMKNKIWHITKAEGLSNNSNYFFYEDAERNIYTGGDGGFSRINFDSSLNQFVLKSFYFKVAGENIETFKNCVAGTDGSLWLAGEKGVFHLINDSLIHYVVNNEINLSVTDIKKDKDNNVWLTTKGDGIWQCYFDDHHLLRQKRIFTKRGGLLSNIYLSITTDNENNIWAGTHSGITSIKKNDTNFILTNYTSNDGFLSSNYQSLKIFCDKSDTIWVATSSGLTSIYANSASINRKLLLSITDISLLDTSKKIDSYKTHELDASIELPYFLNGIEFQFKAICFSDPQRISYSYRMMGLEDTSWLEVANKEIAVYQNLAPGTYSFQVKASLPANTITEPVTFSFIIKKPFWLNWWFIILCSGLVLYGIYILQKKWKKNIQIKHEQKINTQKLISENLQYQLEIEQVTNYFTTSMSARETVDELLWDVARRCISKLNFEDCVIYMKDETTNKLIQKAAWGPKSNTDNSGKAKVGKILSPIEIPVGKGIVGTVAETGTAEIVSDVTKDERYIMDDIQRFSEIAVPIIYDKNILGVIDSESREKNFYSQHHLKILTTIASHCAERIVKLRTEEDLHRHELELLQMQNRLAEEKLTALRSQMNPHFIFNCLNSIQQFILNGQVDNANKYLSQFSRLIRLVLQYSENNFISLEEEINMLKLYLSLEKTRFGDSFEYTIQVDEDLDADEIKIPNLMIQPFVENAIWHGLMHKTGNRKIDISFQLKDDQFIICEVTDNGIGRKRAGEIKQMKSLDIKHHSRGMQLIKDKIDILKQQFKSDVSIEIDDVKNKNGETSGTSVIIKLPL